MKINKYVKKFLVVLLSLSFAVCLWGCFSSANRVGPAEYLNVSFSGYNTAGSAEVEFNSRALIESIMGEMPSDLSRIDSYIEDYNAYAEGLALSVFPRDGLSNGQEITVKIEVSGKAASKILPLEKTYTVTGLKEAELMDVFSQMSFSVSGVDGEATAKMSPSSESNILSAYIFVFDKLKNLSNGDVVTVSILNAEAVADKYNYFPMETTKQFTVSGLPEYLTDASLLPKDQLKQIIQQILIDEKEDDGWGFTFTEPQYYTTYFGVAKADGSALKNNILRIFITYDEYYDGDFRNNKYVYVDFCNIVVPPSAPLVIDYSDGICPLFSFYTDKQEILPELENDYTVTEVYIDWP